MVISRCLNPVGVIQICFDMDFRNNRRYFVVLHLHDGFGTALDVCGRHHRDSNTVNVYTSKLRIVEHHISRYAKLQNFPRILSHCKLRVIAKFST